jgi:hypothetical protein
MGPDQIQKSQVQVVQGGEHLDREAPLARPTADECILHTASAPHFGSNPSSMKGKKHLAFTLTL